MFSNRQFLSKSVNNVSEELEGNGADLIWVVNSLPTQSQLCNQFPLQIQSHIH